MHKTRKNIKGSKGERSTNIYRQTYTRLLPRDYESQKILGGCYTDPKRPQMTAQATILIKTLNYHRWRNQDIP
jgi:hypothetical protein